MTDPDDDALLTELRGLPAKDVAPEAAKTGIAKSPVPIC